MKIMSGVGYSRTCCGVSGSFSPDFCRVFPLPYVSSHLLLSNYLNETLLKPPPPLTKTHQTISKMVSLLALRLRSATTTSTHLTNLLRPFSVFRSFNTNSNSAKITNEDGAVGVQSGSDRSVSRRRDSSPFSGIFSEPLFAPRSLTQMMNLMDQLMENPFMTGGGMSTRRGWDVKEDDNTLLLRVDMPGISKEDVKISVQNNTLTIKGEAERESEEKEESDRRRYSSRIDLDPSLYKLDEIKAEMNNGVLKVIVPKLKHDEIKNVKQIKVE